MSDGHYIWNSQRPQLADVVGDAGDGVEDEENDEEEEEAGFRGGGREAFEDSKDVLIFVIDVRSDDMFRPINDRGDVPVVMALRCFAKLIETKMLKSPSDLLSLVFFGTKRSKGINFGEPNHIYEYSGLEAPESERIRDVEKLADSIERGGAKYFNESLFGSSKASLSDLFWMLSVKFKEAGKNTFNRLMLITDDDNPETDDVHVRSIRRHARDLAATGNATMELFPISLPGTTFDMSKFWQDVVFRSDSEEDDMAVEGASRSFRDLEDRIRRKADRKRSYMRVPFTLGSGMTIGVRGYSLIMEQKRPAHLNVRSDSNEPVKSKQILVSRETAEPLPPDEIEYAFTYGFERVTFTKDEIAQIKNFGPPGIRLLGFKPKSAIKIHHTLKHSIFLFPDEKEYKGSTAIFATLLSRMLANDKVAICKVIARKNAAPRLAALWPEHGSQVAEGQGISVQPGLYLLPLPFADDIRHIPASTDLRASEEAVEAAKEIVKNIQLRDYNPDNYPNPALDTFQSALAAIALNRDVPEAIDDATIPVNDFIMEKAGRPIGNLRDQVAEAMESMDPSEVHVAAPPSAAASKKRGRPADEPGGEGGEDGEGSASKRRAGADKPESLDDIPIFAQAGKLKRATIPQLTAYIKANGIKARGNKQNLMEGILKHLGLEHVEQD